MSQNKEQNYPAIVKRVMDKLQLTDDGKIAAFFKEEAKIQQDKIEDIKYNAEGRVRAYTRAKSILEGKISDAQTELIEAFDNVLPEQVKNNAMRTKFRKTYWAGVATVEGAIAKLNDELTQLEGTEREAKREDADDTATLEGYVKVFTEMNQK